MTFDSCIKGDTLVLDYLKDTSGAVTFLSRKPYIKKLSLRFCSIGTKGVEVLADVNLTGLTSLNLGCNNIGDQGVEALASLYLTNLTSLDLHDNKIGDQGVRVLIEALRNGKFPKLTSVDGISSPLKKDLDVLLRRNAESAEQSVIGNGDSEQKWDNPKQDLNVKVKEPEEIKAQLKREQESAKQKLVEKTKLEEDPKQTEQNASTLNYKAGKLIEQRSQLKKQMDDAKQESQIQSLQEQLESKNEKLKKEKTSEVTRLTEELGKVKAQLKERAGEISKLNDQVIQLVEKEKVLDAAKENASQLQEKLQSTQTQLKRKLESAKQKLVEKTTLEEDLKRAEQNASTLNDKVDKLTEQNSQLKEQMDDAKQESQIQSLQKQLESKNKELNGKNEKFLGASIHSRRQGNYASVSFVLSGAFAVGASLTIPYLAICITFAVAASIFLAVGCYCSYKANTALSNVEIGQINDIDLAAT